MKILYFGTVCDLSNYEKMLEQCRSKPTVATVVFETALLEGLIQNKAEVEIHSFPMIPTIPNSRFLLFGGQTETLSFGTTCRWLRTINLPGIKQITRRCDAKRIIKQWVKTLNGEGIIFTYSIPPFLVKDILNYGKKYHLKTVAIIPDLLRDMYINEKQDLLITKLKNRYLHDALRLQSEYDGYVYLTDAMHSVVAPDKPYIVMEGIANISNVDKEQFTKKASPRAIMYAGMLYEKYGILNLIDAFEEMDVLDTELWLYGDGTAVETIRQRAIENPRIKFFGKVSREEILVREKQATLLVNPRSAKEEYTQYSFPSKMIEYMLSGTPLLTTRLKGIPDEYFQYVFSVQDNDVKSLAAAMKKVLSQSNKQLEWFGRQAQSYIINNKNSKIQANRILNFIKEV